MAETAVSFANQHVLPKLFEAMKMLRDLPKEVADLTDELDAFQDFIKDADKLAEDEEDTSRRERIKRRVMQLREATFLMEDVIDEYVICEEKQPEDDPRCAALLCEGVGYIKTLILRLQIAYKIQDVKSLAHAERDGFQNKFPLERKPNRSRGNQNITWHQLRMDPLSVKEDDVVGLDGPRHILKNWLTNGREERTVVSVVGIPGVGKTTLAKQAFDKVHNDFECHALITVSQSYKVEILLQDMLKELCGEKKEVLPQNFAAMDRRSLIKEVRKHLQNRRYVVLFDDVWNKKFWDDIESAMIDDKNKSRILITTRYENVAYFCKKSSFIEVHKLEEPLSEEESLRLLCKKAFYGSNGGCPEELKDISLEIVRKCKGLPLAIVAIGGLLSQKVQTAAKWAKFSKNLSLKLESNSELSSITKILSLSYNDLPYNLRLCLLYFGMYPEDYEVKSGKLIRQWIAEGFIKQERGKTLEEVAQKHLKELITRSLVQVSSFSIDGKARGCRVHDSIHEMISGKMKDTGFCQYMGENNMSMSGGIIRRLTIETDCDDLIVEGSHIRSILFFSYVECFESCVGGILAKYMPLKVLDFEEVMIDDVPEILGNLIHLKYLSFRNSWIKSLPKSIGKLQNLETLDVRETEVYDMPEEICNLRKLRHLMADEISSTSVKDTIGSMASLQKILFLEIDDDGVVIRELGKLKQLRDMRITNFKGEHSDTLCSSVNEMQFLKTLHIYVEDDDEVIDLHFKSSLNALRKLYLCGTLKVLPNWIPQLQNLVKLSLVYSHLTNDPLESIKDMPNLLFLSIKSHAYEGEALHFQKGGFQTLKELRLKCLQNLTSICFDRGALHSLEKLRLKEIPKLKRVPSGIQHLEKLEVLTVWKMPTEFEQSIVPNGGREHWMIQHVPHVILQNITISPECATEHFANV